MSKKQIPHIHLKLYHLILELLYIIVNCRIMMSPTRRNSPMPSRWMYHADSINQSIVNCFDDLQIFRANQRLLFTERRNLELNPSLITFF